jgi:hypothetical protein
VGIQTLAARWSEFKHYGSPTLEATLEPEQLQRLMAEGAEMVDRDATALALAIAA